MVIRLGLHIFGHHLEACYVKKSHAKRSLYYVNKQLIAEGQSPIGLDEPAFVCCFTMVSVGDAQVVEAGAGQIWARDTEGNPGVSIRVFVSVHTERADCTAVLFSECLRVPYQSYSMAGERGVGMYSRTQQLQSLPPPVQTVR